jgi:perosamine synthetase
MISHSASQVLAADFDYVQRIVDSNFVGRGPLCAELEALLAARFARSHVTLTHSGTAALHLCLSAMAARQPKKTRVLVCAYVCPQVVSAVTQAGTEPVFIDCRSDSLNADMEAAARAIDDRTLSIICANTGGVPDDYTAAAALGVPVISDCAQAVGARIGDRDVAAWGACSILSFGPTKMLTAGAGGAALSGDPELGSTIARMAQTELPVEEYLRSGFQLTYGQHIGELTAGLVLAQLRRLDAMVERRRRIAEAYDHALNECNDASLAKDGAAVRSNRFRYYFLSGRAPRWIEHLRSRDIDARPSISHAIPQYMGKLDAFPNLAGISQRVVSVPIYPAMTTQQADFVADALRAGPGCGS